MIGPITGEQSDDRSSELVWRLDDRSSETVWRGDDRSISHERTSEESAGQKSDDLPAKLFPMINHREGGRGCQKIIIIMNSELFSVYAGSFI